MSIERPDYRIYMNDETWTLNDAINIVYSEIEYKLKTNNTNNVDSIDFKVKKDEVTRNLYDNMHQFVEGEPQYHDILDKYGDLIAPDVLDNHTTRVNIKELIKYVKLQNGSFPDELYEWYLQKSGCSNINGRPSKNEGTESGKTIKKDETVPLTPDERRRYGQLKLQKDTMDMTIKAAVEAAIFYCSLKDGDIFDKEALFNKLSELKLASIPDDSMDLIYQALPAKHKRKPGEKKSQNKSK